MKKIRDFLYHKASIKSILITAALLAAVAGTNFIIYFLKFLPLTGGTAYMELNIGYLPADLFAFAENICMITVLASYPARIMAAAVLARIFTALKYVLLIVLIVLIAYMFVKYRKRTSH